MINKLRLKTFNNFLSYKGQNKYCLIKNMLGTWKSATTETRIMTPVSISSSRDPPDVAHIPLKAFVEKHGLWYKGICNRYINQGMDYEIFCVMILKISILPFVKS